MDIKFILNCLETNNLDFADLDVALMCRTCTSQDSTTGSNIFSSSALMKRADGSVLNINEIVQTICGIEMTPGDGLPERICRACIKQFYTAFNFVSQVQSVDKAFQGYLSITRPPAEVVVARKPPPIKREPAVEMKQMRITHQKEEISSQMIVFQSQDQDEDPEILFEVEEEETEECPRGLQLSEGETESSWEGKRMAKKRRRKPHKFIKVTDTDPSDDEEAPEKPMRRRQLLEQDQYTTEKSSTSDEEEERDRPPPPRPKPVQIVVKKEPKQSIRKHLASPPKKVVRKEKEVAHHTQRFEEKTTVVEKSPSQSQIATIPSLQAIKALIKAAPAEEGGSFRCPVPPCDKTYQFKQSMVRHAKSAHGMGEKPRACSYCDKSFHRADDLTRHIRIHTGERPYACSMCPKSFKQSSELNEHKRTHTKDSTYSCTDCPKTFTTRMGLYQHRKKHEEGMNRSK